MKMLLGATVTLLLSFITTPASAIALGQVDDFQDGTTQNWTSGNPNPNPPVHVNDAGALGVGDDVLQITAHGGGSGPGSKLTAFNTSQWLGDFIASGVTMIRFDANNVGANPVSLGFAINSGALLTVDTGDISPGSGWNTYEIPLLAPEFGSPASFSNVVDFRLRYLQNGLFIDGTAVQVHVDNIRAIPEPSSLLLASCLAALAGFRRVRNVARKYEC